MNLDESAAKKAAILINEIRFASSKDFNVEPVTEIFRKKLEYLVNKEPKRFVQTRESQKFKLKL